MQTLELHTILLHLAIILLFARITGDIFARYGLPSVIGEIFVGILLGQSVFGIIPVNEVLKLLAELGIILLLFHIGLEVDTSQLRKVGLYAFLVAIIGASLPFIFGYLVSYYIFGFSSITSLFIGGTLTATSIGITVRVLEDIGKIQERFSQIVLGAAVLDDILGVIVLSILYEFAKTQTVDINANLVILLYITTFFILAPFAGKLFAYFISYTSQKLNTLDFVPPTVIALILLFAYLAHMVGSPEILGAFTAGLAFSRRFIIPFAVSIQPAKEIVRRVEGTIEPMMWVFTPIFFVYVGLQLNLKAIDFTSLYFWKVSLGITLVAFLSKILSGFVVRGTLKEKLSVGFSMLPRGEVGLIFAEFGRISKVFDDFIYASIIFVVAITTLLAPFVLKLIWKE